MTGTAALTLTPEVVREAFETVGRYMAERERLGEVAVYGGTAIMFQFDWRRATQDVDAVVTNGQADAMKDAVAYAALRHGLDDDWLNDAVGAYTPEREEPSFFTALGDFPTDGSKVGLRVFLARPEYLCAMKMAALERGEDRDFADVVALAREFDVPPGGLADLYASFFPEEGMGRLAAERLPAVAAEIRP